MRYLLIMLSFSLLIRCGRDRTSVTADKNDTNIGADFTGFINAIPNQSLPLELVCGLPDRTNSVQEFKTYSEFMPKSTDKVFGAIKSNSADYKLIIYGRTGDDIYPILFSFDNKGKIIDSLFLILHGCGGADEYEIPNSFVSISNDLKITLTDTTRLIHIPDTAKSGTDYIVDSLRITQVVMKIDQNGRFVKQ